MRRPLRLGLVCGLAFAVLAGLVPCFGQQMHRNAFESNRTFWIKGAADVTYEENIHAVTDQVAHEGQRSEHIQINAKQGTHIWYYYPTANAPIDDQLTISVWVKSNRPGIQLAARVVLPREADPANLNDRLTTIIRGEKDRGIYRTVGSWQRLEIARPVKLAQEQQQLMQQQLNRPINFKEAYIDKLMLNVYGGSGVTDVWIDELEVGPVFDAPAPKIADAPGAKGGPPPVKPGTAAKLVEFKGSSILVDGKRFFFRGIHHTDTPPKALREAGFNTVFVDYPFNPSLMKQMADSGFFLVPTLPVTAEDALLVSADGLSREIRGFPELDNVLFWNLGTALASEQAALVARSSQHITAADRVHPLGIDAWDGLARYSSNNPPLLVSLHRWPLMTTMELSQYKDWLETRSRLANPGTFLWTWIQTHTPDWYTTLLYNRSGAAGFTEPIGPQPEQIRLLTYLAVGSGFRGLGYWSDRFLADSHQGRDRLLTVALLNQELEFLEPMVNTADGTPQWIDTNDPNVKAAVLRTQRGVLVLPMWLGAGSQFVPGQAATGKLKLIVPQIPPSFQAWEVTPGEVRNLKAERAASGMSVTLPDFGLTTAVVFTSDLYLVKHFQELCWARRQLAAQYTYDLAVQELAKVAKVEEQLDRIGHPLPDSAALLRDAENRLNVAKDLWEKNQFGQAYREAQRALRPARIMMKAQWDKAVWGLDSAVASPYAVSFYTLPRHWEFMDQVNAAQAAANVLIGGDFETVPGRTQEAWYPQESTLDDVVMRAERVSELGKPGAPILLAKEGKQFLVLEIKPKAKDQPVPKALERTYLAINSPTVKLPPGTLVRVSGWICIPEPIQASSDGALLYDSAGGEPLGIRLTGATAWKKFTLYRRVPASGMMNVTVALTGLGRAAFDDLRIEPLITGAH
jgi:hypothetical protein